jgi:dolichyl-phosphate beta-glucosyltransferase
MKINSISIIFPIYNEEKRLYRCFGDIKKFNQKNKNLKKEYIFVNDGSLDNSYEIIKIFIKQNKKKNCKYKLINQITNRGKGYALRIGEKSSTYKWTLTVDADISVSLIQLNNWIKENYIKKSDIIYFGSRNHKNSRISFKLYRRLFGLIFNLLINFFLDISLKDTQCGFKLYHKKLSKKIFKSINDDGFIHDLEIVLLSKKNHFSINELPVKWNHVGGSKLNIISDSIKMFYGIIRLSFKFKAN